MNLEELNADVKDYTEEFESAVKAISEAIEWAAKCEMRVDDAKLAVLKYELKNPI